MSDMHLQLIIDAQNKASEQLNDVMKSMNDIGKEVASASSHMSSMEKAVNLVTGAISAMAVAFGSLKLADMAVDAALAAARYETLGVVMNKVGENSGYTSTQMNGFATALQKTGISMTESNSIITKMAQSQLDLTKSTELARIAQDAAVIGNINSSEAMSQMVYGIQSAQVEVLRTIGINVNFENSYKTLADQLGKTKDQLTESEKATARMNAVLAAGPAIAGVYEAAMDSASKQLQSMERYAADLQVMLGKVFTPALTVVVKEINDQWKAFNADIKKSEQTIRDWGIVFTEVAGVAVQAMALIAKAVAGVTLIFGELKSKIGTEQSNILGAAISNYKTVLEEINQEIATTDQLDTSELQTRASTLTAEIAKLTAEQNKWNQSAAVGETVATAAANTLVKVDLSAQALAASLVYSSSIEKKAADDLKKAQMDATTQEMALKGVTEQRWQSTQKIASDQTYKEYLDKTTDSIVLQEKEYKELVKQFQANPIYEALKATEGPDAANDWVDKKIKELESFEKQSEKTEKGAQKLAIALQEMHSKFAESNSDEYAKGVAELDKDFLKLQASLKGSAEGLAELDQWYNKKRNELTFKQDIETLTTLNEKLKEADSQLNQLTMTSSEYSAYSADAEFEKQITALMALNESTGTYNGILTELIDKYKQIRDLKKAKAFLSEEDTEYALKFQNAMQDVNDKIAQITMSAKEYSDYSLARQFEKDMTAALAGGYATEEYRKKLEEYYALVKKTNQSLKKEIEQIYDQMWKNIQTAFSDTIYDMFEKGIDGFSGFFDKIMELFKKMLAQMVAAWLLSGLKGMFTGYGIEGFSLSGLLGTTTSSSSPVESASSALTLASLAKSLWNLPETIASIPDKLLSGLGKLGEFLGLSSSAPSSMTLASSNIKLASTVDELVSAYLGEEAALGSFTSGLTSAADTSVAAFDALEAKLAADAASAGVSANLYGALEGGIIAGIISLGAYVLPGLIGGGEKNIDLMYELKKWEAGYTNITKETADLYKTMLLSIDDQMTYIDDSGTTNFDWNKIDAWIAANQEFLKITTADIDRLLTQQAEINSGVIDSGALSASSGFLANDLTMQATVDVAIKMAQDAASTVSQKMYQLGFIANKAEGGWESEAVTKMIAEFKNQGVAWEEINNALINYGATDSDFYKRIYAEYHGDSVLTDLQSLTAALSAEGISEDVLKTIKYIYESNIPLDQMQALLEWAGLSSEEAARIVGQIDPSDEWKDLVIPVDAPDSIPVDYSGIEGRASGGMVSAGSPYVIGEAGPELFIPSQTGHILSNYNMQRMFDYGVPGMANGTINIGYSASSEPPKITINVTNNSTGTVEASTTSVTRTDQGIIVDLVVDAIERNVGGKIRSMVGYK